MSRGYTINKDYFHVIDDEHKAYWLGFIYADGYLNKKEPTVGIELELKDKEHLMKFNTDILSNRPIHIYNKKSTFGPQVNCRWKCHNSTLYNDLIAHGISTTKFYDGQFPIFEDEKYVKDIVRGIFDGDGSLSYRKGSMGYLTGHIGICGTKETLEYIEQFSGFQWSWSQRYPNRDVNNYQIDCGRQDDVVKFLNTIYQNAENYLDRKYQKYLEYTTSRQHICKNGLSTYNYNNVSKRNISEISGVSWDKQIQKWHASIGAGGNTISLGYFIDIADAIRARKDAEVKYLNDRWQNGGELIVL